MPIKISEPKLKEYCNNWFDAVSLTVSDGDWTFSAPSGGQKYWFKDWGVVGVGSNPGSYILSNDLRSMGRVIQFQALAVTRRQASSSDVGSCSATVIITGKANDSQSVTLTTATSSTASGGGQASASAVGFVTITFTSPTSATLKLAGTAVGANSTYASHSESVASDQTIDLTSWDFVKVKVSGSYTDNASSSCYSRVGPIMSYGKYVGSKKMEG